MEKFTLEKQIEVKYSADVVVCGGGTAGAFAALSAANEGKSVIIIEQFGGLGGSATFGLVTPVMHSHISNDPQCSYISKILNKRLAENGGVDVTGRVFDPMMLKIMLEQLCMESKIKMLFHSFICDVVVENEKIKYVVIANKSGTMAVEGKMFIDCTGDGDVSVLAGAKFTKGNPDDGKNQPISLRYIVDGVDVPELGRFFIDEIKRTGVSSACSYDNGNIYGACCRLGDWTLGDLFDKAIAAGDLIPQDKWYWQMFRVTGRPSAIAFNNPEFFEDVDGTNVEHLTRTQLEGKQTILRQMKFYKKYFKGFENAFIAEIAPMVGIRESRNITTEYVLSAEDLLSRKKFDDAFCQSNYPVDIHGKTLNFAKEIVAVDDGRPYYEIPYRALVVKGYDNLLVAGRCLGAEFLAQSSLRVQQSARSSGEAAGIAAAIAVQNNIAARDVDGSAVRGKMVEKGAEYALS